MSSHSSKTSDDISAAAEPSALKVSTFPDRSAASWSAGNNAQATILSSTALGEFAALTDKGRGLKYQANQDAFLVVDVPEQHTVLVSVDGIGGHGGGELASNVLVESLAQDLMAGVPVSEAIEIAKLSLAGLNRKILLDSGSNEGLRMGATFVALEIKENLGQFWHAGDSKGVLIRAGKVIYETKDHSQVQELVDAGFFTPEQALTAPLRNVVTSGILLKDGIPQELPISQADVALCEGDIVVLGSDGLWDLFLPSSVAALVSTAPSLEQAMLDLRAAIEMRAKSRDFDDNVNFILYAHGNAANSPFSKKSLPGF